MRTSTRISIFWAILRSRRAKESGLENEPSYERDHCSGYCVNSPLDCKFCQCTAFSRSSTNLVTLLRDSNDLRGVPPVDSWRALHMEKPPRVFQLLILTSRFFRSAHSRCLKTRRIQPVGTPLRKLRTAPRPIRKPVPVVTAPRCTAGWVLRASASNSGSPMTARKFQHCGLRCTRRCR